MGKKVFIKITIIKILAISLFFPIISSEMNLTFDRQEYMQVLMMISGKDQQKIEEFIKLSADINKRYGPNEESLLHIAITGCTFKAAQLLIDNGINVDQTDKRGWTPLASLVIGAPSYDKVEYPKLAELLFEKGRVSLDNKTIEFLPECKNDEVLAVIERFKKEKVEESS